MKTYTLNTVPCEKLCEITTRFGQDIAQDAGQTRAILNDFCGQNAQQYRREIFALVSAVEEHVPALLSAHAGEPMEIVVARMSKRLHDHRGLDVDLANWTVASWALALEIWDSTQISAYLQALQYSPPSVTVSMAALSPTGSTPTPPARSNLGKPALVSRSARFVRMAPGRKGPIIATSVALGCALASLGAVSVYNQSTHAINDGKPVHQTVPSPHQSTPLDNQMARDIINNAVEHLIVLQSKTELGALTRPEAALAQSSIRPRLRQADDLMQRAIRQNQQDQEAWELSARARYYLGDYNGAEARVNAAIRLFPSNSNLPTLRMRIQAMRKKQMRSISSHEKYIPNL
ncbi:hypothetical protein CCAX7_62180 [Capsulimonas corticalis]|uniref:Uncharacterized protein n=1 Tax=Capsulimonas corticalis TaxID=2219043 RepID=A0A402CWK3_9BACT|nr:tetratricopeptide repeat protein [Capsulimonas corticalis]BDI34167.1 hypothetical protein CCAX7_62180 [Capsulimonas corticalis]